MTQDTDMEFVYEPKEIKINTKWKPGMQTGKGICCKSLLLFSILSEKLMGESFNAIKEIVIGAYNVRTVT